MKKSITTRINFNKVAQFCEALVLVCLTLLLCGLYVYFGRHHKAVLPWLLLCAALIPIAFICAIAASYMSNRMAGREAKAARFKITEQLILTLRAEKMPLDVRRGLGKIADPEKVIVGENRFLLLLEETLGKERTREIKAIVFKYARV